MRNETAQKK